MLQLSINHSKSDDNDGDDDDNDRHCLQQSNNRGIMVWCDMVWRGAVRCDVMLFNVM